MLRLMVCFVRREGLSNSEFRRYWRSDEHNEKIASLVDLFGPDHYADTLAVQHPDIEAGFRQLMGRGVQYDSVLEFYWNDESIIRERLSDRAVAQILRVLRDQSIKRVDPEKTSVFLTEVPELTEKGKPQV